MFKKKKRSGKRFCFLVNFFRKKMWSGNRALWLTENERITQISFGIQWVTYLFPNLLRYSVSLGIQWVTYLFPNLLRYSVSFGIQWVTYLFPNLLWYSVSLGIQWVTYLFPNLLRYSVSLGIQWVTYLFPNLLRYSVSFGIQWVTYLFPNLLWYSVSLGIQWVTYLFPNLLWYSVSLGIQWVTYLFPNLLWYSVSLGIQWVTYLFPNLLWYSVSLGIQWATYLFPNLLWYSVSLGIQWVTYLFPNLLWYTVSLGIQWVTYLFPNLLWYSVSFGIQWVTYLFFFFFFFFFLYNNENYKTIKKNTVNIKLETALPQDTMVISPGVQPLKEKVATTKKGITRVQQKSQRLLKKFWSCIYSNKDPQNRLDEIMKLITAWRISRFTLSARAGLPYNSILHKVEILNGNIITSMFRRSSKRIVRWSEKLEQCNRKCSVVSMALVRQEQKGSTMSKKPCLNLCSRRWLKPTLSRVSKISPLWFITLNVGEGLGRMNLRMARLKEAIDERFLIWQSSSFHLEIQ